MNYHSIDVNIAMVTSVVLGVQGEGIAYKMEKTTCVKHTEALWCIYGAVNWIIIVR